MFIFPWLKNTNSSFPMYLCFVDNNTGTLLFMSTNVSIMSLLRDHVHDVSLVYLSPSNFIEKKIYKTLKVESFHLFYWDNKLSKILKRDFIFKKDLSDHEILLQKSQLLSEKYIALSNIVSCIDKLRNSSRKKFNFQEFIYVEKKIQAQRFKDRGYLDSEILEYPYVLQYADYADLSFKESADTILLKAKMGHDVFAKTELLRLRYVNLLKDARTISDVKKCHGDFLLDFNIKI